MKSCSHMSWIASFLHEKTNPLLWEISWNLLLTVTVVNIQIQTLMTSNHCSLVNVIYDRITIQMLTNYVIAKNDPSFTFYIIAKIVGIDIVCALNHSFKNRTSPASCMVCLRKSYDYFPIREGKTFISMKCIQLKTFFYWNSYVFAQPRLHMMIYSFSAYFGSWPLVN